MEKQTAGTQPTPDALWIKYQLRRRGYTLTSLGREHGVSRHAVSLALRRPYPKMEAIIAKALGLPPAELWPDRYDQQGNPNRPLGRPQKPAASNLKNHISCANRNGKSGEPA
ncbi:MAG: helix-turn-helix domain-containing protein [Proteobacteria bacterium]|nr:helix-turn-helix domain-containing protein [Pseudomonadota bacterium]MBU4384763.1 helix-turn-helix domain-containing protein [Pseudomonadota bacterium]MCG2764073.1 helix-turn-helix domain-containing protein [Desulfarculaceae bacterium]